MKKKYLLLVNAKNDMAKINYKLEAHDAFKELAEILSKLKLKQSSEILVSDPSCHQMAKVIEFNLKGYFQNKLDFNKQKNQENRELFEFGNAIVNLVEKNPLITVVHRWETKKILNEIDISIEKDFEKERILLIDMNEKKPLFLSRKFIY